jgi:hypothetical protein
VERLLFAAAGSSGDRADEGGAAARNRPWLHLVFTWKPNLPISRSMLLANSQCEISNRRYPQPPQIELHQAAANLSTLENLCILDYPTLVFSFIVLFDNTRVLSEFNIS